MGKGESSPPNDDCSNTRVPPPTRGNTDDRTGLCKVLGARSRDDEDDVVLVLHAAVQRVEADTVLKVGHFGHYQQTMSGRLPWNTLCIETISPSM